MAMSRHTARQLTHVAQIAGLVALATLAGVIVAPRRAVEAPAVQANQPAPPTPDAPGEEGEHPAVVEAPDWTTLAVALNSARDPMPGQSAAPIAADSDQSDTVIASGDAGGDASSSSGATRPRPQPAPPGWQYIGYARITGGRVWALVAINTIQRFVHAGVELESYKLVDVDTERLILERDGHRFEVKRAKPAPFDVAAAMASAPGQLRGGSARGRNAQLERQRMQQLEEERNRRLEGVKGSATTPAGGGAGQR